MTKTTHTMKKALFIAALALGTMTASAQSVVINTYQGTDITKYDGLTKNVSVNRYVLNGWNTISLPFAVAPEQVDEVFGSDCRLEKLVGVESAGNQVTLNFMDCKAEGIKANVPYILYYAGETAVKRISVENARLQKAQAAVNFSDINGTEVTFAAAQKQRQAKGVYGILAKDNGEAAFVSVDNAATMLYATRCFVTLSNGTASILKTSHIAADEATAITSVLRSGEKADVYNLSGTKVAEGLTADAVSRLSAGVYVVKGKKVAVR